MGSLLLRWTEPRFPPEPEQVEVDIFYTRRDLATGVETRKKLTVKVDKGPRVLIRAYDLAHSRLNALNREMAGRYQFWSL